MFGLKTKDQDAMDDRAAVRRRALTSEAASHAGIIGELEDQTNLAMAAGVVALGIRNQKVEMARLQSKFDVVEDARKDITAVAAASKHATDLLIAELAAATGESIEQIVARVDRNKNREYNRLVDDWVSTKVFRIDPRLSEKNYENRSWFTPNP